jgi:hypothetical protein
VLLESKRPALDTCREEWRLAAVVISAVTLTRGRRIIEGYVVLCNEIPERRLSSTKASDINR